MKKYSIARVLPALTLALGMACYTPVKLEVSGEDADNLALSQSPS